MLKAPGVHAPRTAPRSGFRRPVLSALLVLALLAGILLAAETPTAVASHSTAPCYYINHNPCYEGNPLPGEEHNSGYYWTRGMWMYSPYDSWGNKQLRWHRSGQGWLGPWSLNVEDWDFVPSSNYNYQASYCKNIATYTQSARCGMFCRNTGCT